MNNVITRPKFHRQLAGLIGPHLDALTLRRLASRDDRLAHAITLHQAGEPSPVLNGIEKCRAAMLHNNQPLVDGTLGPAGIYDGEKTVAEACSVSKQPRPANLLFALGRSYSPKSAIELGTNVGISSAYLAAGMAGGNLTTLEASPYRERLARELHRSLELTNITYVPGLFADTLPATLKAMPPVDMAYIDGHHQYQPTLDYFDMIWRHSVENCVVVFDDIRWSRGMKRAWRDICRDRRVAVAADLWSVGVCITRRQGSGRTYKTLPMVSVLL